MRHVLSSLREHDGVTLLARRTSPGARGDRRTSPSDREGPPTPWDDRETT